MKIEISKNNIIYNYSKPYVIAEIGANHNGSISLAKKMILSAKESGADCVKFQSWTKDSLISKEEYDRNQTYDDGDGGKKHFGSLKEMVSKYMLTEDQHFELKNFCDKNKIDFCSTPFSKDEADLLNRLNVSFFKIASMDINNFSLLKYVAKFKKPIMISTGMSTISEIDQAVKIIEEEGNKQIVILHCISIYPPKIEDINLNNILMLQKAFDYPIGFSDHSIGASIPLASVALGGCVIEKHFTLDKEMEGWDHQISASPLEMKDICVNAPIIQKALGKFNRVVSKEENSKKDKFRRSIVSVKFLKKGTVISEKDLDFKRPGTGISPNEMKYIIGRVLKKDIDYDVVLKFSDFL